MQNSRQNSENCLFLEIPTGHIDFLVLAGSTQLPQLCTELDVAVYKQGQTMSVLYVQVNFGCPSKQRFLLFMASGYVHVVENLCTNG